MKKQLLLLISMLLPLVAMADAVEIDGIYYNLISKVKTAEVTTNPLKYKGKIIVPETITYDGINYSVTSIGEKAFSYCPGLTSIEIPSSITSIGTDAFIICGLTKVIIRNIAAWCEISFYDSFSNPLISANHLYDDNNTEIKDLVIPNSVTSIGNYAFSSCTGLTSVTIPNSVTSIGDESFRNCTGLTSVTIPNSVTSIGDMAFSGCSGLTYITIPNSITSIGGAAFRDCSGLKKVIVADIAAWCGISFGKYNPLTYAHHLYDKNGTEITDLVIPNSVTSIESFAFEGCSGLSSITIPNSVTKIGSSAFENCNGLSSIEISNGIKNINNKAFANCAELTDVYCYAESVPTTESDAFEGSYIGSTTLHVPSSSMNLYKTTAPWSDFKEIVSISGETLEKCATPTISFKDGKLHFECETPDVTYHYTITPPLKTDNTGNDVEVGSSYTVQVYASKDGYLDSDTATQDIDVRGLKGDVNGDGDVTAQDASLILQKVAGKIDW